MAGRHRPHGTVLVGTAILAFLLAVALAAPLLAPYDPDRRVGPPFAAPSGSHLLGTNDVGQDLLSELVHGARISLVVGTVAAVAATMIGAAVGMTAGYLRGGVDAVLMRIVDVVLSLPVLPLTIVVGVFAGPGLRTQILVIASVIWAGVARELRAQVLSLRERDHIAALRAMGARTRYVVPRHVVPAVAPLMVPQFVLATKTAILLEASLAFLGLGDLSAKSWGTTLSMAHARSAFLTDAWLWWVIPPGVAIGLTVLGFALVGAGLEERVRPALRDRRRPVRAATTAAEISGPPLVIDELTVRFGDAVVVDHASLTVASGEILGLVGESGSGKTTVAGAVLGLLSPAAHVVDGRVLVCGRDPAALDRAGLRALRGGCVGLVPQEAMSALNPVRSIGDQLAEAVTAHCRMRRGDARRRVDELLALVALDPARARNHAHQLSGGMRQRVVIAMALAGEPAVLVADEPTSGLDVLMQVEVLDLLADLRRRLHLAVLVISHDLPVIESVADRIAVMHAGRIVETGPAPTVVGAPEHPYTRRLVEASPRLLVPEAVG